MPETVHAGPEMPDCLSAVLVVSVALVDAFLVVAAAFLVAVALGSLVMVVAVPLVDAFLVAPAKLECMACTSFRGTGSPVVVVVEVAGSSVVVVEVAGPHARQ